MKGSGFLVQDCWTCSGDGKLRFQVHVAVAGLRVVIELYIFPTIELNTALDSAYQ